jgi:hypothetical protein
MILCPRCSGRVFLEDEPFCINCGWRRYPIQPGQLEGGSGRHQRYPRRLKRQILARARAERPRELSRQFNIPRTTIQSWVQKRAKKEVKT